LLKSSNAEVARGRIFQDFSAERNNTGRGQDPLAELPATKEEEGNRYSSCSLKKTSLSSASPKEILLLTGKSGYGRGNVDRVGAPSYSS